MAITSTTSASGPALTSAGIGSGLDVTSIVGSLMTAERAPLDSMNTRLSALNAKISSYGAIKSAVSTFESALSTLVKSGVNAQKAASSAPDTVNVSADGTAIPGSYAIGVTQLAAPNKLISAGVASATATTGAGTMSIQVGTATAVTIPAGDYSMKTLAMAINGANAGVNATIINDGSTNHLVVTAQNSGAVNAVKITASGGLSAFDTAAGSMATQQAAQDALLTIDGVAVTKPSNTVSDAIPGVTLNLTKLSSTPVAVTVARDDATVKSQIVAFVTAYNAVHTTIMSKTAYDVTTRTASSLTGDSGAASVMSSLSREMSKGVTDSTGKQTSLSAIGITFQRDGSMAVDDTKLSSALATNSAGVTQLLTGANGVATRLSTVTTGILADTGVLSSNTAGFTTSVKSLTDQETAFNDRMVGVEAAYRAQYTALDTMISGMNTTQASLTQMLAKL